MAPPPGEDRDPVEKDAADDDDDDAVDDTEDLDDDFAKLQQTISNERRAALNSQAHGIGDLLPFPFAPNIRPLTISDLESCLALENAAFRNPQHRCSREKFIYRLTACSELSMGVFCTIVPSAIADTGFDLSTMHTAHPVETSRDDGAVSVLMAHIIATRSHEAVVTDKAMDYPRDYASVETKPPSELGNQENGRTLCIHSLAVHPKLQGVGLGKLIMKCYLQRVKNSALGERVALICQDYLVNYYKRFGFTHAGPSEAAFGGGGWQDMTLEFGGSSTAEN
ncbi:polyamine acetyltransferase, variant [Xylariaceae sp. FL1019]|nr:polyamine acetyltransferase, variant [Xylariaceae sp. FL1019]